MRSHCPSQWVRCGDAIPASHDAKRKGVRGHSILHERFTPRGHFEFVKSRTSAAMVLPLQTLQETIAQRLLEIPVALDGVTTAAAAVLTGALLWTFTKPRAQKLTLEKLKLREPATLSTTRFWLGNTLELTSHIDDMHDWMAEKCLELQGEPYKILMIGRPAINVLYTPEHFEEVFKTHFDAFPKGPFFIGNVQDALGHGIFAVDGKAWLNQRKVTSHLFTMRSMRDSMAVSISKHLTPLCRVFSKRADSGESMDLFRLFNRFSMETFAEIGFGVELDTLESESDHPLQAALDTVTENVVMRFLRPSWFWKLQRLLNVGAEGEMKRAIATLDAAILDIIAKAFERRASQQSELNSNTTRARDVVSLFLDHLDGVDADAHSGIELNTTFFRDVVMNLLFAGRDSTAQTLSWLFVELDRNPEVVEKIRDELVEEIPHVARGDTANASMEDVQGLVYLEAVIRETLRLHPVVPCNSKHVARDVVLSDGTILREGSTVSIASWAMGRMPFVWGPDAAEFKPERWIDEAASVKKLISVSQYKFIAFNAGPRLCLGMNLAMMEMKMVLATLLSRFHVALVPGQTITYVNSATLPIKGELRVTIREAPLVRATTQFEK